MTFPRGLLRVYHYVGYAFSWSMFAGVGLLLNLACAVLLLAPNRARLQPAVRTIIRRLFAAWCAWLHAARLVCVSFHGFTPDDTAGPAVYIANHPSLLDATFLLSRLPNTICIFKPAIMRNPVLGPAALMAGYASGDAGVDLIRDVAARVAGGQSLLVFPEGTRTVPGSKLNPFKPGFALIAARAHVPVRLIGIRAARDLLPKGWPYLRPPSFPTYVDVTFLGEIELLPGESATELTARATRQLSAALAAS